MVYRGSCPVRTYDGLTAGTPVDDPDAVLRHLLLTRINERKEVEAVGLRRRPPEIGHAPGRFGPGACA